MKLSAKQAVCGLLLVFLASFALGAAAWLCLLPRGVTDGLWTGQMLGADQAADQIFSHRDAGAALVSAPLISEASFDQPYPERLLWKLFGSADDFKPGWLLAGGRELEFIADQGGDFTVLVSQDHSLYSWLHADLRAAGAIFLRAIDSALYAKRRYGMAELPVQLFADDFHPFALGSFHQHDGLIALPHQPNATVPVLGYRPIIIGGNFFFMGTQGHADTVAQLGLPRNGSPLWLFRFFLGLQGVINGDVTPVASMFFDKGYQPLQLIHFGSVLSSENGAILLQFSKGSEANQFTGPILQRDQTWQNLETGQPELVLILQTLPLAVPVEHPGDALQGPKALAFFHQLRIGVIDPLRQDWDGRFRIGEHQRAFDAQFQFSFQRSCQHKILPLNGHRMLIGYRGRKRGFRSYGGSIHVVCNRNLRLSSRNISTEVQA